MTRETVRGVTGILNIALIIKGDLMGRRWW